MWPSFLLPGWQGYSTASGQGVADAGWHLGGGVNGMFVPMLVIYADFVGQKLLARGWQQRRERPYIQTAFIKNTINVLQATPWMEVNGTRRD
jgi:hypothetical protein